jgi:sulfur carrier protein
MTISVNGEAREVRDGDSIAAVLEQLGLAGRRVAVAVNREVVPRASHDQHALAEGDKVEIVQAVQGG